MSFQYEIVQQPAQPVISIKTRTPAQDLPKVLSSAFSKLGQFMKDTNLPPVGPPFVAYFNMDMSDLEIEIGFPVAKSVAGRGEVQPGEIPAGRYAACLYTGPYKEMKPAYDGLATWVDEQGFKPSGVSYEYYLNEPETTAPEALQTRIVFPLC